MEYSYPLLQKIFDNYNDHTKVVSDIYLACCQHLLEPQMKMFELFINSDILLKEGFTPSIDESEKLFNSVDGKMAILLIPL